MKIYGHKQAPNPRRVRIFLAEKGVSVPTEEVDIFARDNRKPPFLAKNPLGGIPVLELDDGTCIAESVAICRYLEGLHPKPALFGETPLQEATIEMWNRRLELVLFQSIGMVWIHGHPLTKALLKQIPENVAPARARAAEFFALLDAELAKRPFIAGPSYSIADVTALCAIDFGRFIEVTPDASLAHLARWHAAVSARPSAGA
ncbi:MAG TPA: glutathione S-transferase family protein [Myxococcota bacterium]|nr:glutathione S-transferase family protein [Myxococcota bacterium]